MIASTKRGLYAVNFGGGQVDITNGKFVFQCTEAYLIEDGKVTTPVKGATLIGDGPTALTKIVMIGDDFEFDPGVGVCGKAGQGVPVGIGQPSLKMGGLTVGGTAVYRASRQGGVRVGSGEKMCQRNAQNCVRPRFRPAAIRPQSLAQIFTHLSRI